MPSNKSAELSLIKLIMHRIKSEKLTLKKQFRRTKRLFDGRALSIKKLTLLGFSLVSLPLVIALIYSAIQVNKLSTQGAQAIFSVAELTKINQALNEHRTQLERFASQFVVLKDAEIKLQYNEQRRYFIHVFDTKLVPYLDEQLTSLSQQAKQTAFQIDTLVTNSHAASNEQTLEQLQQLFITLALLSEQVNQHSNTLISGQATKIEASAEQVSRTMLISLLIIPITLIIAGFFIYLITSPLKQLIQRIQSLEQGNFEQAIVLKSSPEIQEIIDALETMRLRLHALELQKSSFIRHISHELKTPLAAIREGTELIYDNSVGSLNSEQQEICQIIRDSVGRLQRHIEELLDFNIVLDSTSLQDSEKIALHTLVTHVFDDHKLDIKRKQLKVINSLEDIYIYSNVKQLRVILDNIISNAIKYSDDKAKISISGEFRQQALVLHICDQGPGIAENLKEKVFEAFYQGPPPLNSQVKGSGLGLTIVKELLMRLNGEIHVDNIKDDQHQILGLAISISLPRVIRNIH